jgi:protein-S-isoprenylcysteine O-methyltransferase Ste14
MNTAGVDKIIRLAAALITGAIALSGYAGVVGLLGGEISFGDTIDARLPFGSLFMAGLALLAIVAVPMTVASVAAGRGMRYSADIVFGAGLVLVGWIAVELAFIKAYSWFHPTYLVAAIVVLGLSWLMNRTGSQTAWPATLELRDTQLHG